jgi:hypothetical protein
MKYVKSTYRTSVSYMRLKSVLMALSTKFEPQQDKIVLGKHQYHSSRTDCLAQPTPSNLHNLKNNSLLCQNFNKVK